jgi:hypothetical protein
MTTKTENAVQPSQRIVVAAGQRVQVYVRYGESHGARALMELVGPVTISCVSIERVGAELRDVPSQ